MANSLGQELCTYLQNAGIGLNYNGSGTINCWDTLLLDQPDLAAALLQRGGVPPLVVQGTGTSKWDQPVVQVMVRSGMTDWLGGNTLSQNIFKTLHDQFEVTLNSGGAFFHWIRAMQSPIYLGQDERQRHMWSQNFHVWWDNPQR